MTHFLSHAGWKRLSLFGLECCDCFERPKRRCDVVMDDGVELRGKDRTEIVADPLGRRPIDHADGALKPRLAKHFRRLWSFPKDQHEVWPAALVEQALIAFA